jgi:hypothetical protein
VLSAGKGWRGTRLGWGLVGRCGWTWTWGEDKIRGGGVSHPSSRRPSFGAICPYW